MRALVRSSTPRQCKASLDGGTSSLGAEEADDGTSSPTVVSRVGCDCSGVSKVSWKFQWYIN